MAIQDYHRTADANMSFEAEEPWFKCRHIVSIVGFMTFIFLGIYRMHFSVAIVAMVNHSALSNKTKTYSDSCPVPLMNKSKDFDKGYSLEDEFNWSPTIQGYILGSYYLSFVIMQIPLGKLAEKHGCKWLSFWGTFISAVATLLIPNAARMHPYVLILMQILRGIGQGVYQSSGSLLAANWFPKMERGLLYGFMKSGAPLGAFLGSIFSGLLCKSSLLGGWPSSFYIFGCAGLILSAAIAYFIHETPSVHPNISEAELKYILSNQENVLSQRRPDPPWREILTSVPVYALCIGYFGQIWALSQYLVVHATFLGTILHYSIEQNGFLSAVPFLLMFLFSQVSSTVSSFVTKRNYATIDQVRKICCFTACLGYSLCLLGVYFAGCDKYWSCLFSTLSVGFIGFGISGTCIVSTDISPTFAASINGIACTFGYLPSFFLPLLVGYLTDGRQTLEQWNIVFFIGIGTLMTTGLIFVIFGSAEIQPWNFVEDDQKPIEDKKTSLQH